jgi:hypothetical protein
MKSGDVLEVAQENMRNWQEALLTRDPVRVTSLYAPGAILLGTFSDRMLIAPNGVQGYFEHFLQRAPEVECLDTVTVPCDSITTGLYNFRVNQGMTGKGVVFARVTMALKDGQIVSHHSSELPK